MATPDLRPPNRMSPYLLLFDWCIPCQQNTDQELDGNALICTCTTCNHQTAVSKHYVRQMLEE